MRINLQEIKHRLDPNRHRIKLEARRVTPIVGRLQTHDEQAQIAMIPPPPGVTAIPSAPIEGVTVEWRQLAQGEGTDSLVILGKTRQGMRPLATIPAHFEISPNQTVDMLENAVSYLAARGVLQEEHFPAITEALQQPPRDVAIRRSLEAYQGTPHERVKHTLTHDWVQPAVTKAPLVLKSAVQRGTGKGVEIVEKAKTWLRR